MSEPSKVVQNFDYIWERFIGFTNGGDALRAILWQGYLIDYVHELEKTANTLVDKPSNYDTMGGSDE